MASGFNLTAQLQLQAPTNTQQVASQIQKQLSNVSVNVNVKANKQALAQANNQLTAVNKSAAGTSRSITTLNRNLSEAARRFSVITIATGTFISFARAIKNSVGAAVAFEREMVKISQVTGNSVSTLSGLAGEVTKLSVTLGVANQSLLETARVLSQAGLSAVKTKQALEVLANTTLAPSFDNIIDTTEGAIAILNQFGREAAKTGQDIKFLEQSLDAINAVSKNFAVESADLIATIRRTGGVFQAAGGNLKELIALFTSVRQTTRESAETIATGFRTIFTRLQRAETIDALKELGIALTDAEGKFVGPMKAIEALSVGLAGLDPKDVRFNEIVEQLGGFRQIGKVIPLLKQYSVAQQALAIANNSAGSTAKDAQTAQQSLAVQFTKVREQFDALIRKFADSDTFRSMAGTVLQLATSFLKFAEILKDILPQLTAIAAIKIGQNLAPGIMSIFGGGGARKNMGGRIHGFSGGGWVPGTGSRDTVPAMLTPGEFVIKKSSASKLGENTLAEMNAKGYASGGKVSSFRHAYGPKSPSGDFAQIRKARLIAEGGKSEATPGYKAARAGAIAAAGGIAKIFATDKNDNNPGDSDIDVAGAFLMESPNNPQSVKPLTNIRTVMPSQGIVNDIQKKIEAKSGVPLSADELKALKKSSEIVADLRLATFTQEKQNLFKQTLSDGLIQSGEDFAKAEGMNFNPGAYKNAYAAVNKEQVEGGLFEALLAGMSGNPFDTKGEANETFDFPRGLGGAADLFGLPGGMVTDAKRSYSDEAVASIIKKAAQTVSDDYVAAFMGNADEIVNPKAFGPQNPAIKRANKGGSISGSDTVPALLTPGEFVVKKSAAQSIGYSNLASMNKTGIAKFNKGGAVGHIQRFADGGKAQPFSGLSSVDFAKLQAAVNKDAQILDTLAQKLTNLQASSDTTTEVAKRFSRAMSQGATLTEAWNQAISIGEKSAGQLASEQQRAASAQAGKGPSATVGAGADAALRQMAGGHGDLDVNEDLYSQALATYTEKLQSGATKNEALQATSDMLNEQLTKAGGSYSEAAEANRAATEASSQLGGDYSKLTAQIKHEADAAGQVARIQELYVQKRQEGMGHMKAMSDATKEVAETDGKLMSDSRTLSKMVVKRIKAEKELEKEMDNETKELKKSKPGGPGGGGGGGGGGGPGGPGGGGRNNKVGDQMSKLTVKLSKLGNAATKISGIFSKVGSVLSGIATAAIGATLVMGTLIEQSASLSEAEKEQEQAGLAAVAAAIGLGAQIGSLVFSIGAIIAQTVAWLATTGVQLVAKGLEIVASFGAAAADTGEAAASIAVTAALGPFALAAIAITAALAVLLAGLVVIAAFLVGTFLYSLYKSAKAAKAQEQAVKKFNKVADKELDKLTDDAQTGTANEETFVDNRANAAMADFNKVAINATKYTRAFGETMGAAEKITKGLMIGQAALVVLSNPVGLALAATAAAGYAAGRYLGYFKGSAQQAGKAMDALETPFQKFALEVGGISRIYATSTFRAAKAIQDFDASMRQAEAANLDAVQSLSNLAGATGNLRATFEQNQARGGGAEKLEERRRALETRLKDAGILSGSGTETGKEPKDDEQRESLSALKELNKQRQEMLDYNNKLLAKTLQQEASLRQALNEATGSFINEIAEGAGRGAGIDLAQMGSFNDIITANNEVFKAYQDGLKELKETIQFKYEQQIKAEEAKGPEADQQVIDNLVQQRNTELALAVKENELATLNAAKANLEYERASIRTRMAEIQKQKVMRNVNNTMKAFNTLMLGANAAMAAFAKANAAIAITSGSAPEAVEMSTEALDAPINQIDPNILNNALNQAVAGITAGANPLTKEGQKIFQRAKDMRVAIEDSQKIVDQLPGALKHFMDPLNKGEILDKNDAKKAAENVFNSLDAAVVAAGGSSIKGTAIGDLVQQRIEALLAEGKEVTFEDIQKIQDEVMDLTEEQRAAMVRAIEVQNAYIQQLDAVNSQIIEVKNKYSEALATVVDVQERAADRMAKATGNRRSINDREQGRRRAASERLGNVARGVGARAGNVQATAGAMAQLEEQARLEAEKADKLKRTGGTKEQIEAANNAAKEFQNGAAKARAELERMADQSARAGDIMEEIAIEQKKRQQLQKVGEDLAFGSDDTRKSIAEGFKNVRLAVNQGGMQGATDEQRASIAKTLDSLSDVEIGGTGKTGRELKAQFQADEIMRLTGNQALAQASFDQAMAGSREEQLLQQLADVGKQEEEAARALADQSLKQIGLLQDIKTEIKNSFNPANAAAQAQADKDSQQAAGDLDKQLADLQARLAKVDTAIGGFATQIGQLESEVKLLKSYLVGLGKSLKILQGPERAEAQANRDAIAKQGGIRDQIADRKAALLGKGEFVEQKGGGFKYVAKYVEDQVTGVIRYNKEGIEAAIKNSPNQLTETQAETLGAENTDDLTDFANFLRSIATTEQISGGTQTDALLGNLRTGGGYSAANMSLNIGAVEAGLNTSVANLDAKIAEIDKKAVQAQTAEIKAAGVTNVNAGGAVTFADGTVINVTGATMADGGAAPVNIPQVNPHTGGYIGSTGTLYRAKGGSIFKPKGTDTVPAMLTPGEFVIRKSAVDKIGLGALQSLNNGDTSYFEAGGLVPSGFFQQALISASSDLRTFRKALGEVYGGKEGLNIFRALQRLSKTGVIKPENIASAQPFEDYVTKMKTRGTGRILNWKVDDPQLMPIDGNISANLLAELKRVDEFGKLTADSSRVSQETKEAVERERARLNSTTALIEELLNEAPTPDNAANKGVVLAHKLFEGGGFYEGGNLLDKMTNYKAALEPIMEKQRKELADLDGRSMTLGGPEGTPVNVAGIIADIGAEAAAAQQAEEQAQKDAAMQGVKKKTEDRLKGLSNRKRESIERDFKLLENAGLLQGLSLSQGGEANIPGQDTVPAMLTPGEFVMSNKAVKKYGIGYMKSLNRGRVPGFNKGGLVGRGNVSYLQNGGSVGGGGVLELGASNVQAVLDNFNNQFGGYMSSLMGSFATFNQGVSTLASAISGGMDVRLSISGDLTTAVSLNGDQADHIKTAIADAVVPTLVDKVSEQIEIKFEQMRNNP